MMKTLIQTFCKAPVKHKVKEILSFCTGKIILDVGCVGQDTDYDNPLWLHKQIVSVAAETIGVDRIIKDKDRFAAHGYTLFSPGELHAQGKKFDVIVMADVIEHISDIADFLTFYLQFLNPEGQIILTTPNPFSIRRFFSVLLYGHPGVNPEHTVWFDPATLDELVNRAGLRVAYFCWLHEYSPPHKFRYYILYPIFRWCYSIRKFFAPNFLMILTR